MESEETKDTSLPLVIVNPKSASGSTRDRWSSVAADLRAHFGPFAVAFTKGAGDGTCIAERAAKGGGGKKKPARAAKAATPKAAPANAAAKRMPAAKKKVGA